MAKKRLLPLLLATFFLAGILLFNVSRNESRGGEDIFMGKAGENLVELAHHHPETEETAKDSSGDLGAKVTSDSPHARFLEWYDLYRQSTVADELTLLEGVRLAKERKESLYALIAEDTQAALGQVMPLNFYTGLPEEVSVFVERPISGLGDIDLLWATTLNEDESTRCSGVNKLYLNGEHFDAYGVGRRELQMPTLRVPVFAYGIDDRALLLESPVYELGSEETAAAELLFGEQEGNTDPMTGRPSRVGNEAVIAGVVQSFSEPGVVANVEELIINAEQRAIEARSWEVDLPLGWLAGDSGGDEPAITQSSFFADDNISVLFIRCDFSDFAGSPIDKADLESDLVVVSSNLDTLSYGTASVTAVVTNTLYRATGTGTSYAQSGDDDALYDDVVAVYDASPEYSASSAYDVVAVYFPRLSNVSGSLITYGGLASVGGTRMWINGLTFNSASGRQSVITHEFGHNYGLYHSNYWHPEKSLSGDYYGSPSNSLEYGDIFDRMGSGSLPEAHFNHYQKHRIEWLPENNVATATGDATYRIYRFDDIDATDNPLLALRVPMGGDVTWWVGHRQLYDSNTNMENGAYVVAEGLYANRPNLIDMTPESEPDESSDRSDAALPVGESLADSDSGVTFTTLASGTNGVGDEWIDVQVDFDPRAGFASALYEVEESSGIAILTLQRSFDSTGALTIDYATSDNGATAGTDYYATSGTVSWDAGDSSDKTIAIHLRPDSSQESGEGFTVTLSNPVGGVVEQGASSASVSILDPGERYANFSPDFFNNTVNSIAFQSDGKAIIGGTIDHTSGEFSGAGNIARVETDGSADATFNSGGSGFNDEVNVVVTLSDDRVVVGGQFTSYNGVTVPRVALLGADGDLDTSFNSALGAGPSSSPENVDSHDNLIVPVVHSIVIDSSGRFLIGGAFDEFDGVGAEGLARLTAQGGHDSSLSAPFVASFASVVYGIDALEEGDIFVTGRFYLGPTGTGFRSGVIRLNDDGSMDSSFDPDAGLHDTSGTNQLRTGYSLAIYPDGDFLVGGDFTGYDENTSERLVRINPDGTFVRASPVSLDRPVSSLLVEPFGGVLVGELGDIVVDDPEASAANLELFRLAADWTQDTNFTALGGPGSTVYDLKHSPDGSLWVGGNFFTYNGESSRPIVRVASGVSPYDFWTTEHFTAAQRADGTANPENDADGDGIPNLGEMALGTDPTSFNASSSFAGGYVSGLSLYTSGENQYLQLTIDKSAGNGGVWYGVQVSSDLSTWSPDPVQPGDDSVFEIIEDSSTRLVIRDRTAISPSSPRFVRVVFDSPQ